MTKNPQVVDTFMFAYEHQALAVRLEELKDSVTLHVAAQGDRTFRGEPRDIVDLSASVITREVSMPEGGENFVDPFWNGARGGAWMRDKYLRDVSLLEAVSVADPDAFFVVCDGDEIPHPESIAQAISEYDEKGPRTLPNTYREWYANWIAPDRWQPPHAHMNQPVIGKLQDFTKVGGAHMARCARWADKWPYTDHWGWHLSNLGDAQLVSDKFGQFAHTENNNRRDRDVERLEKFRTNRLDATKRFELKLTDDVPLCVPSKFPELLW
ncbi:hypothetical protein PP301_gp004 [Gordonia phage GMA2]|uniref:Glycosyltransferase n=1 Tax=Gordonia phage GMA2 TaxID=1647283 RepID=A0A0K0N728_9CAUD|nr:hypothetical protein PP301_gp004 [Gordonia phage GMA2]AKJ72542.1 hypothetical protein GMA2_4 [Gordonia phage GMA2]